jgi:hypothetical protein
MLVNGMPPSAVLPSYARPPHLRCIVTADSLSAHAPPIETLHDHGRHSLLGGKEGAHTYLFQQVQAAEPAGRVTA